MLEWNTTWLNFNNQETTSLCTTKPNWSFEGKDDVCGFFLFYDKKIYGVGSTTSQNQQISHEGSETSYAGFALVDCGEERKSVA